jgi:hypothetical protein
MLNPLLFESGTWARLRFISPRRIRSTLVKWYASPWRMSIISYFDGRQGGVASWFCNYETRFWFDKCYCYFHTYGHPKYVFHTLCQSSATYKPLVSCVFSECGNTSQGYHPGLKVTEGRGEDTLNGALVSM